jgi:hypothetical protein
MVRGVVYFGTPFQGSRNADTMAPLIHAYGTLTRTGSSFVNEMRTSTAHGNAPLMMRFNNIRNEESIDVLVFIEKLPDGPSKVVSFRHPQSVTD